MPVTIYQVDAFTDTPFAGNPAAVCFLPEGSEPSGEWMQNIAMEMNLSETAFLRRLGPDEFRLRWFTPTVEVPLCGHATLASAHVLWESGMVGDDSEIQFQTVYSGTLKATREGDWIQLDFPAMAPEAGATPPGLFEALGVDGLYEGKSKEAHLVLLEEEGLVRTLQPDTAALVRHGIDEVIVTAPGVAGGPFEFVSRFFAPGLGIPEDPVTGAAHCTLAPYWCNKLDKMQLTGYQASGRSGVVRVTLQGDRVQLAGNAITVMQGKIHAEPR